MNPDHLNAAIESLWEYTRKGIYSPSEWKGRLDVETAYRVQLALLERHIQSGATHVGWKVGLTAKAIQKQFEFHEPVFGFLLGSGALSSGVRLKFEELNMPGFENELCVTLGAPLRGPGVTRAKAREAIDAVAPALEIVEKRGEFAADPPLSLADNVQQRAFVTGVATRPLPPGAVLGQSTVKVYINGELVGEARGTEVLGDPAASVAWLANRLHDFGVTLEAGMKVMTGSFTKQFPLAQGDVIEARFDPYGMVTAECI
ncbi:MAG: fumarylacetoacetate hydrolase family protein [Deltaproteobacteria bacterium]|nr:fumarylacetoacetate hydrolase family protein [Deltaproteobacteria bacterium]